jgi:hypothetical protein
MKTKQLINLNFPEKRTRRATYQRLCAVAAQHNCCVFSFVPWNWTGCAGVFYSGDWRHQCKPLRSAGRPDLRPIAASIRSRRAIVLNRWLSSKSVLIHELGHLLSLVEKCYLDDYKPGATSCTLAAAKPISRALRRCARHVGVTDTHSLSSREELRARLFELRTREKLPATLERFTERIWHSFQKSLAAAR